MEQTNIPTAERFLWDKILTYGDTEPYGHVPIPKIYQAMKEFAQLHVEAALKAASEKATMCIYYPEPYEDSNENGVTRASADDMSKNGENACAEIEKDSILTAYPKENIK